MVSKTKNKKIGNRQSLIMLIVSLLFLLMLIIILMKILNYNEKDYYQIETRKDKVSQTEIGTESDFETIGWLRVQGTSLDMPIVYSSNRSTQFPVELGSFVWSLNKDKKFHNNIYIMGHNIFNLSSTPKKSAKTFQRFEELMAFIYYDFAKDNKYIQLTLDGKEYLYKIFSVGFLKQADVLDLEYEGDLDNDDMKYYLGLIQDNNIYDYDIDVNENDKIISLVTCTRFFGPNSDYEFFVNGRLLRDGEEVSNYNVKKSKNYKKIEKKLKGDGKIEEDSL